MDNGTIGLSDLVRRIEERDAIKSDVIVDPRNINAVLHYPHDIPREDEPNDPEPLLAVPERLMSIGDVAHDQLATWSPIGTRYYRRMLEEAPSLWRTNLNHWLHGAKKPRMLRTLKGGNGHDHLRAFLSDKYGRYEDAHLLRPVLERAADKGWGVDHCALTDRRMHVRVMFPKLEGEVKVRQVGMAVRAGAAFSNSEVGFSKWRARFFIMVLACLNGMEMAKHVAGFERTHLTGRQGLGWLSPSTLALEDALLQAKVGDTLEMLEDGRRFEQYVDLMQGAADTPVHQPIAATRELARRVSLTQDEQETVVRNYVDGGDSSLWGLVNALTATARERPGFERRAHLEAEAGKIIEHPRTWKGIAEAEEEAA